VSQGSRLAVLLDGKPLPDDDARALWKRFSEYLDKNRLDFDGFAKLEGLVSIRPESRGGTAVLVASTRAGAAGQSSASQRPDKRRNARSRRTMGKSPEHGAGTSRSGQDEQGDRSGPRRR